MIAESIAARGMMRTLDIGFLAVEMAAHLRAGASYERAWQQSVRAAWEESAGKGPSGQQRRIGGGGLRWWKLLRGWESCQEDDDVAVREGESGWAVPGVVAQYALPRSRPERGRLLHAIRAGGCEWERYLRVADVVVGAKSCWSASASRCGGARGGVRLQWRGGRTACGGFKPNWAQY